MLKSIAYSLITKLSVAIINLLILLVSSRYLGVSSRGEISIFILNLSIIQLINEVYTGYSLVHFIPKFNFKKVVLFGLMISVLFCALSNFVFDFFHKQIENYEWLSYFISLAVIVNTFNCVLILAQQNLKFYNFISFLQPFLLLLFIGIYIFLLKIYTVEAYIYPLFFSFITAFLISSCVVSNYFFKSSHTGDFKLSDILKNGLLFQSSSIMYVFCNRYSYYLLPEKSMVGLYSSASSLMEALLIIVNAISPVLLSRMANKSNESENWSISLTLAKFSLLVSFCITMLVYLIPDSIFTRIFGEGFAGIKSVMIWYAPSVLLASFFMVLNNYFIALGKQKEIVISFASGFIGSMVLAPILVSAYGMKGAALNAFLSFLIISLSLTYKFFKQPASDFNRIIHLSEDIAWVKTWLSKKKSNSNQN